MRGGGGGVGAGRSEARGVDAGASSRPRPRRGGVWGGRGRGEVENAGKVFGRTAAHGQLLRYTRGSSVSRVFRGIWGVCLKRHSASRVVEQKVGGRGA